MIVNLTVRSQTVSLQVAALNTATPGGGSGDDGWSPILAVVTDGARRVHQIADWTGGGGTKPATGGYIGASGIVALIGDAVDIRGAEGETGATGAQGPQGETGATGATGATGPVAGSSGQLIYNNAGAAGGAGGTHWDAVNGRLSIGAGTSPAGMVHAQASAASVIPAVLQGAASQTAALQQWQDSAGTPIADISPLKQFSLYNIAGANYERIDVKWASNVAIIDITKAGTGTQRDFELRYGGYKVFGLNSGGAVEVASLLKVTGGNGAKFTDASPLFGYRNLQAPLTVTSYTLAYNDGGAYYVATSASDQTITMPSSGTVNGGVWFGFKLSTSKSSYLRFTANTGQKIRLAGGLSASGGYVRSNVGGSFLYLMYDYTDAEWVAWQQGGTWTIDS